MRGIRQSGWRARCGAPSLASSIGAPGFSLVELVLVIVTIGLVAAIAVPRFAGASANYRASLSARRIAADLDVARSRAVAQGRPQSVVFTAGGYRLADGASPLSPNVGEPVDLAGEPYRAAIVSANFSGTMTAVFNGYGAAPGGGEVVVRSGDSQKRVVLDAGTGRATVQ